MIENIHAVYDLQARLASPRISCILPTRNRRAFLQHAIALFEAQDYPNRELIIVEDGDQINRDLAGSAHLYMYLSTQQASIGVKRNWAASMARGSILCQWDDDDYYGPHRLSQQAAPILAGCADVTAYRMTHMLDVRQGCLWECSEEVHRRLFAHNVRSGTLMYRYALWEAGPGYAAIMKGEDVAFLHSLIDAGARLEGLADPSAYVCVRHGDNITQDIEGTDLPGWRSLPMESYFAAHELAFYRERIQESAGRAAAV